MIFVTNDDQMGKNIRFLRQAHDLSPEAFCALTGLDPDTLEAIETGVLPEIDGQILVDICRHFGIDVQAFVEDPLEP